MYRGRIDFASWSSPRLFQSRETTFPHSLGFFLLRHLLAGQPLSFVVLQHRVYLVVFYGIMAQTLPLSKPLWNFFGNFIWIDGGEMCQIPLNLLNCLRTAHHLQPSTPIFLRAVTVFMVNRSCAQYSCFNVTSCIFSWPNFRMSLLSEQMWGFCD